MRNLAAVYRPSKLSDVIGQDNPKRVLQAHLNTKPKGCYLFCGGAGTGKTTCARIFAHELNKGKTNVIEINAANNNGIDDMRQIISDAQKKPIGTMYRIFVLDECHMLSNSAWNCLLKLIEEPPATVVLLMCTTDPQKIPNTILSRVIRLDFSKIDTDLIQKRLCWVLEQEGCNEYDKDSLLYIAQLANGGMRDALSMLDKVVAYEAGVNQAVVNQALGLVGFDDSFALLDSILERDGKKTLEILSRINSQGTDLKTGIRDFRRFVLNATKAVLGVDKSLIPMPESEVTRFYKYKNTPALFLVLARVNEVVPKTTYDSDPYTLVLSEFLRLVNEV